LSDTASTLASQAYTKLRTELLAGSIEPGSKIRIRQICAHVGVGLSPMREALNRLASEGLVIQSDRRGFTAAPLDLDDLADLTLARSELNAAALRDAIAYGGTRWAEQAVLAHHRMAQAESGSPEWDALHRAFHASLLSACRSQRLLQYCAQLFDAADRYRLIARASGGGRDAAGEHAAILQALVERDANLAVALLRAHVEATALLVRRAMVTRLPAARS